jgi:hypothetical protein
MIPLIERPARPWLLAGLLMAYAPQCGYTKEPL